MISIATYTWCHDDGDDGDDGGDDGDDDDDNVDDDDDDDDYDDDYDDGDDHEKKVSETLRSSLNCLFAFSWFSSSGVCKATS